jgi:hypothetical protein
VLDWLFAAFIGAGGSVIGGLVGGWFALRAGHRQWQRDREDARTDRSHAAAMTIAESVVRLWEAVTAWQSTRDYSAFAPAYNTFSRTIAAQSLWLTDDDLGQRVRDLQELAAVFGRGASLGESSAFPPTVQVRDCTDALADALKAHVHGEPLPPYQSPPLGDAAGLSKWTPTPRSTGSATRTGQLGSSSDPPSSR